MPLIRHYATMLRRYMLLSYVRVAYYHRLPLRYQRFIYRLPPHRLATPDAMIVAASRHTIHMLCYVSPLMLLPLMPCRAMMIDFRAFSATRAHAI